MHLDAIPMKNLSATYRTRFSTETLTTRKMIAELHSFLTMHSCPIRINSTMQWLQARRIWMNIKCVWKHLCKLVVRITVATASDRKSQIPVKAVLQTSRGTMAVNLTFSRLLTERHQSMHYTRQLNFFQPFFTQ